MTIEDINRMAQEAGFPERRAFSDLSDLYPRLERFAAIVAAAEREACAKECEKHKVGLDSYFEIDERIQECADAIRARGNT